MEVLVLRTWLTNIGNGFIDKGAKMIIRKAFPDADIIEVSGYPGRTADQLSLGELAGIHPKFEHLSDRLRSIRRINKRMVNVADYVDADVAVLPGCILNKNVLTYYEEVLQRLTERGVEIVLLGAGGSNYDEKSRRFVRKRLDEFDIEVLLTRDSIAHECYSDYVNHSYDGIDCGFFISDWYTPSEANKELAALTFDKVVEPETLSKQLLEDIVRPNHAPFGHSLPYSGIPKYLIDKINNRHWYKKENAFVSDTIEDYLFWYANATVTHSDRIHACVPALSYGNAAQFHYDTPRDSLFDSALEVDIRNSPAKPDMDKLESKKEQQVNAFREIITELPSV